MRIIAGKYKAKKLNFISKDSIRPTADMVKQAMFTTLFDKVNNAVFLDLFCGSGQVGIEALSRGAKKVVFVDNDFDAMQITKKNLTGIEGNFEILKMHYAPFLRNVKEKFDIIFIDPPYKSNFYTEALNLIILHDILSDNGIIICEHDRLDKIGNDNFDVLQTKNYGKKSLSYLIRKKCM